MAFLTYIVNKLSQHFHSPVTPHETYVFDLIPFYDLFWYGSIILAFILFLIVAFQLFHRKKLIGRHHNGSHDNDFDLLTEDEDVDETDFDDWSECDERVENLNNIDEIELRHKRALEQNQCRPMTVHYNVAAIDVEINDTDNERIVDDVVDAVVEAVGEAVGDVVDRAVRQIIAIAAAQLQIENELNQLRVRNSLNSFAQHVIQ